MKKELIIGLAVLMLMTGCQHEKNIEEGKLELPVETEVKVKEDSQEVNEASEEVSEDIADILEESVVSELHEWTSQDTAQLKEFTTAADALSLEEAKGLLDEKIKDTSHMMADEYVAYYEERLISELSGVSSQFFEGTVQEDLASKFNYGYFSRKQLQEIESAETLEMIDGLYDLGYKVETSEGMYYPILDYSVLYKYEDQVTSGVKKYLRLMKRQSDIMAYSDAAVIVPWSELGERLLMAEELQSEYLPKTMKKRVEEEFEWAFMTFVFGTNNTPVFDFENNSISDPEVISAFKEVAKNGGNTAKSIMVPYLKVLDEEDYKGTDRVYETVNKLLGEHLHKN
jgi:hypothetical protein